MIISLFSFVFLCLKFGCVFFSTDKNPTDETFSGIDSFSYNQRFIQNYKCTVMFCNRLTNAFLTLDIDGSNKMI